MQMQNSQKYISSLDNPQIRLHMTIISPKDEAKGNIAYIHGLGEWSGRHFDWASRFVEQGFCVYLIDLRGFGYSGGAKLGTSLYQYHQDVHKLLTEIPTGKPLYLYGHSMGGALIVSYLLNNPGLKISGIILSSPMISVQLKVSMPEMLMLAFQQKIAGSVTVGMGINPTAITKDDQEVKELINDKLSVGIINLNQLFQLVGLMQYIQRNVKKFQYNYLMACHGDQDTITECSGTEKFVKAIPGLLKQFNCIKNGYHELHRDDTREEFYQKVIAWITTKCPQSIKFGNLQYLDGVKSKNFGFFLDKGRQKRQKIIGILLALALFLFIRYRKTLFGKLMSLLHK